MEGHHYPVTRLEEVHIAPEPEVLRANGAPITCARRLLTIHAHPDDESSKGGGSATRYAAAGVGTVLVCCTGGEAGTILNPALDRPEVKVRLPEIHRAELTAATQHLGYQRVWMLGYRDSNMPASGEPGTFAAALLEETVRGLVRIIRQERPHVIVTYSDNQRGYQHPDHLRVHDASVPAWHVSGGQALWARRRKTTLYPWLECHTARHRCQRNAPIDVWKRLASLAQVFPFEGQVYPGLVNL